MEEEDLTIAAEAVGITVVEVVDVVEIIMLQGTIILINSGAMGLQTTEVILKREKTFAIDVV